MAGNGTLQHSLGNVVEDLRRQLAEEKAAFQKLLNEKKGLEEENEAATVAELKAQLAEMANMKEQLKQVSNEAVKEEPVSHRPKPGICGTFGKTDLGVTEHFEDLEAHPDKVKGFFDAMKNDNFKKAHVAFYHWWTAVKILKFKGDHQVLYEKTKLSVAMLNRIVGLEGEVPLSGEYRTPTPNRKPKAKKAKAKV